MGVMRVPTSPVELPGLALGVTRTLTNTGNTTLYWGDQNVSVSNFTGSIAPGGSVILFAGPRYVVSGVNEGEVDDEPGQAIPAFVGSDGYVGGQGGSPVSPSVANATRLVVSPVGGGADDAAPLNAISAAAPAGSKITLIGTFLANSGPIKFYGNLQYDLNLATIQQTATPGTPMIVNHAVYNPAATATDAVTTGPVGAVWTVTAGTATGGSATWSLTWNGDTYTTPAIAFNASAAVVQAAILAASTPTGKLFPFAGVVCAGGALGTAPVTITFQNDVTGAVTALAVAVNSYTGGTAPAFVSTTTGVLGSSTIVSPTLAAVAVVGQGISVAGAGPQPNSSALMGVVGAVAGNNITLVDPAYGIAILAGATVTGASAKLYNIDRGIRIQGGTIVRSDTTTTDTTTSSGLQGKFITCWRWVNDFQWTGGNLNASANLIGGGELFKYAISITQAVTWTFSDITFNTISDGIHVDGGCYKGTIRTIKGTTGDDFVVLSPRNATNEEVSAGDVRDINISDLHGNPTRGSMLALYSGVGQTHSHVTVTGLYGRMTNSRFPVNIANYTNAGDEQTWGGGVFDDITIKEIHAVSYSSLTQVYIINPSVRNLTLDGVYHNFQVAQNCVTLTSGGGSINASVEHLTIKTVRASNVPSGGGVLNINNARIGTCTLSDWKVSAASAAVVIRVQGTAPYIGRLMCSDHNIEGASSGSYIDAYTSITAAAFLNQIFLSNVHIKNFGNVLATALPGVVVNCSNLRMSNTTNLGLGSTAAIGCRFIGSITTDQTVAALAFSAPGSCSVHSPLLPVSTLQVTPVTGDMFYNYLATATVPVANVIWDGARYKSLRSPGSLASALNQFTAGTFTIANTAITATSFVRLTRITPAGTVGILGVVLTPGTGFTVNSYTGTGLTIQTLDTSKVFWEIVQYA